MSRYTLLGASDLHGYGVHLFDETGAMLGMIDTLEGDALSVATSAYSAAHRGEDENGGMIYLINDTVGSFRASDLVRIGLDGVATKLLNVFEVTTAMDPTVGGNWPAVVVSRTHFFAYYPSTGRVFRGSFEDPLDIVQGTTISPMFNYESLPVAKDNALYWRTDTAPRKIMVHNFTGAPTVFADTPGTRPNSNFTASAFKGDYLYFIGSVAIERVDPVSRVVTVTPTDYDEALDGMAYSGGSLEDGGTMLYTQYSNALVAFRASAPDTAEYIPIVTPFYSGTSMADTQWSLDPPEPPDPVEVCFWMDMVGAIEDCGAAPEPTDEERVDLLDDAYVWGQIEDGSLISARNPLEVTTFNGTSFHGMNSDLPGPPTEGLITKVIIRADVFTPAALFDSDPRVSVAAGGGTWESGQVVLPFVGMSGGLYHYALDGEYELDPPVRMEGANSLVARFDFGHGSTDANNPAQMLLHEFTVVAQL